MPYGDNPAQRLLDLFATANALAGESAVEGWARVFGVPPQPVSEVLRQGAQTVILAADTRAAIEALTDDDPELVLEYFGGVEATVGNFLSLASHANVSVFMSPYNDMSRYCLRTAASLLHRKRPEQVLPDDQVAALLQETRDLINQVMGSDLGADLRLWIIRCLRSVEAALVSVKVTGTSGIENATDEFVGAMVRQPSRLVRFMTHPVWPGALGLLTALNVALGTALEWQQLTENDKVQVVRILQAPPAQSNDQPLPGIERGPR